DEEDVSNKKNKDIHTEANNVGGMETDDSGVSPLVLQKMQQALEAARKMTKNGLIAQNDKAGHKKHIPDNRDHSKEEEEEEDDEDENTNVANQEKVSNTILPSFLFIYLFCFIYKTIMQYYLHIAC
ncbi:hypothetical protein RFI_16782, partial [Reticulomyxa filosa]